MPRYPTKKIEIEQCEPESTFLDDVDKLVSFLNTHNNTLSEYVKVTRMYLFGTPIRRTGAACHQATPGCIRLKLYSSKQEQFYGSREAAVDDVVDFPLEKNGDLDFERVKLWWGIKICAVRDFEAKNVHSCFCLPCRGTTLIDDDVANKHRGVIPPHHWQALEPYNCKVFQQGDPNKISGIAIHNLTAGTQNAMDLIYVPTETDEYRRKEQGSWIRELKWHRRMFVYDPAWYFNRLLILCALFWIFSLIPGSFAVLNSTFIALKSAAISLIFTFSVAARWMREVELTIDPRMTETILRSLM